ncbi:hypothetical protein C7451_109172 [Blastomonas natatoria]|uniref:Uncharacterized protein n=1 Tax=Blastomonas natatoria TaxID=34015 RepID=A0A2V3UWZ0_9SPHN|nr:hypothetical protein [Blastomonas natatoria]PXW73882.1 hypothetical protein C7451_109172 [Blastomonas natatoria]
MVKEEHSFLGTFGMDLVEIMAAVERAQSLLKDKQIIRGMNEFDAAMLGVGKRKSDALRGTGAWLADAGNAAMILLLKENLANLDDWKLVLDRVLIHPPSYRDLADWWLFFSALDAQTGFQLERCTSNKLEGRLTGHLLEALSTQGKIWSAALAPLIARTGATLAISEIDLEVGGGEQTNGGDFGIILDFDGRTVQPGAKKGPDERRIVPLIFQAKRYQRPIANVSQTNPTRGPQRDLLASNVCASAYIFYDNGGNEATPLPPLVKPVEKVPTATKTNVLEHSLDFATYLLQAATNPTCAPRAISADDALAMIFTKAEAKDLTDLVVVSTDPEAGNRYRSSLALLNYRLSQSGDEEEHVHRD